MATDLAKGQRRKIIFLQSTCSACCAAVAGRRDRRRSKTRWTAPALPVSRHGRRRPIPISSARFPILKALIQLPLETRWPGSPPTSGWTAKNSRRPGPARVLKRRIDDREGGLRAEDRRGPSSSWHPDGAIADPPTPRTEACYDQQALMRRYDVITEICDYMLALGWKPYQNDHEDANGQFEMNWEYDDVLVTADRHVFFKFTWRNPSPRSTACARPSCRSPSRLHRQRMRISRSGTKTDGKTNLFGDPKGELGLLSWPTSFWAAFSITPTRSAPSSTDGELLLQRINAPRTVSGATWSPNTITWSGNNRTHMDLACRMRKGSAARLPTAPSIPT